MTFFINVKSLLRHTRLMNAMIDRLGLRDAYDGHRSSDGMHARALQRCTGCSQSSACESWLEETQKADKAPSYCQNGDLFERLKREIEATA